MSTYCTKKTIPGVIEDTQMIQDKSPVLQELTGKTESYCLHVKPWDFKLEGNRLFEGMGGMSLGKCEV